MRVAGTFWHGRAGSLEHVTGGQSCGFSGKIGIPTLVGKRSWISDLGGKNSDLRGKIDKLGCPAWKITMACCDGETSAENLRRLESRR